MQKPAFTFLTLLLVTLLSACGFTLRGSVELPAALQTMILDSQDGNSDIAQTMRRSLTSNGITLVDSAIDSEEALYRLVIGSEESSERALSINSNARAGEYEISMSLPIQLSSAGEFILGPETLTVEKAYLADPDNAVAKNEEADLLREEMRRELVSQILRRLQTLPL